jgi:hypothetical protein
MKIGERERETERERHMETLEMMNSLEKETGEVSLRDLCEKMIGEKRERNREGERYVEREREGKEKE